MNIIDAFKKIKPEESIFGCLAIITIIMHDNSGVPSLVCTLLLAFYYVVFSWYIFPIDGEKHTTFSILAGIVYGVCLVSMAVYSVRIYDKHLFFYLEGILLLPLTLYLAGKKEWKIYRILHFIRIVLIVLLNVYLYIFYFH